MTLTIDLPPELEVQIKEEALKTGVDTTVFILDTLREKLRGGASVTKNLLPHLSEKEARLLLKINEGMDEDLYEEYKSLTAKRQAETLTSQEHAHLIVLTNQREIENARRMERLAELARLRKVSLRQVMKQLGIVPPTHA